MKTETKNTGTTVNIWANQENILRGLEVAIAGRHTICLIPTFDKDNAPDEIQMQFYRNAANELAIEADENEIDFRKMESAEICLEVCKPSFESLFRATESIESIAARILKVRTMDDVEDGLDQASRSLLKTAYEKLNLQPHHVEKVIAVAATIAKLYGATRIERQHIAEAIQYQAIDRNFEK